MTPLFIRAFNIVLGIEGGYQCSPTDPGNWTGGKVGSGVLKGTKFGISAAQYPKLDIRGLAGSDAMEIFWTDYWLRYKCDRLPPALALVVFDTVVNGGFAIKWLQTAVGAVPDGVLGDRTLAAINGVAGNGSEVLSKYLAQRALYMMSLRNWDENKTGWMVRLFSLAFASTHVGDNT